MYTRHLGAYSNIEICIPGTYLSAWYTYLNVTIKVTVQQELTNLRMGHSKHGTR